MSGERPLEGQVALVTGASSGIGRATALLLGRRGAHVIVNYNRNSDAASAVVTEIEAHGSTALAIRADVTDHGAVSTMVQEVLARWGRIDILVNNAGGIPARGPLRDCSPELWRQVVALNLDSVYNCCHAVLPGMLERGFGRIVNVSSGHSRSGGAAGGAVAYAAVKAGVNALTMGLGRELASSGVLVNAVAVGLTDTPLHDGDREGFERRKAHVPLGRAGQPEEMAEAIYFVCSAATFMVGETIYCTGGL
jgi:3-oxoacyl-[acyl-carrier protein] reductase